MSSCNDQKVVFGFGASFEDSQPDNMPEGLEYNPGLCRRDQVGHIKTASLSDSAQILSSVVMSLTQGGRRVWDTV